MNWNHTTIFRCFFFLFHVFVALTLYGVSAVITVEVYSWKVKMKIDGKIPQHTIRYDAWIYKYIVNLSSVEQIHYFLREFSNKWITTYQYSLEDQ